jgi:hypothetical protein
MAETSGDRSRRTTDIIVITILLVLVIALVVWMINRGGNDDAGIDVDIDVPAAPTTTGSMI